MRSETEWRLTFLKRRTVGPFEENSELLSRHYSERDPSDTLEGSVFVKGNNFIRGSLSVLSEDTD